MAIVTLKPRTRAPWSPPFLLPDGTIVIRRGDRWMRVDADSAEADGYRWVFYSDRLWQDEKRQCLIEAYGIPLEQHGAWMYARERLTIGNEGNRAA